MIMIRMYYVSNACVMFHLNEHMSLLSVSDNTKIWTFSASGKNIPSFPLNFPMLPSFWLSDLEFFSTISSYLCFFFLVSLFINIFVPIFQGLFVFSVFLCRYIKRTSAGMEKKVILQKRRNKDMRKKIEHECTSHTVKKYRSWL